MTVWLAVAAFLGATLMMLRRGAQLIDAMDDAGPRVRRRRGQRMVFWVGWWELSVAAVLAAFPGSSPANVTSVAGVGVFFLLLAWFWKRVGLPV